MSKLIPSTREIGSFILGLLLTFTLVAAFPKAPKVEYRETIKTVEIVKEVPKISVGKVRNKIVTAFDTKCEAKYAKLEVDYLNLSHLLETLKPSTAIPQQ